jgi:hypothetical protein
MRSKNCSRGVVFALLAAFAMLPAGCGGRLTAEARLDKALKQAGHERERVFPLAGRIMIDGAPPEHDPRNPIGVMLVEREEQPNGRARRRRFAECNADEKFAFSTYEPNDGVKPGNYVIVIAKLARGPLRRYVGPDQLRNLYNDPDKNAQIAEFCIEHKAPGKTDYEFRLTVAGVEPVEIPGPHAVTAIP